MSLSKHYTPCPSTWPSLLYLKSKVGITPPPDIATLRQRTIDKFDALRHQAPMIRRAVREMEKRANLCVERNGGHVEGHGM